MSVFLPVLAGVGMVLLVGFGCSDAPRKLWDEVKETWHGGCTRCKP